MNANTKKQEKLLFNDFNFESEKKIKNNHQLKNPVSLEKPIFNIKLIPPSCIKSSFEDEKWVGVYVNKSRVSDEIINFTKIPSKWKLYIKKVLCIVDQLPQHKIAKTSAFASFSKYFTVYKHFFNQLESRKIEELKDVREHDLQSIYLDYATGKSKLTNQHYIKVIKKLYDYGPSSYQLLTDGLILNPGINYLIVGNAKKSKPMGETEVIEEDTSKYFISSAIDWVINKKHDLLELIEIGKLYREEKGIDYSYKKINIERVYLQAKKDLYSDKLLYQKFMNIRKKFNNDLVCFLDNKDISIEREIAPELLDFIKLHLVIRRVIRIYQAFAYTICASFTGWRASEVFSINPENLKETSVGYYLGSNLIKTTKNKDELISRPVPEIVVNTILNLIEVHKKMDGLFKSKFTEKNKDDFFLFKTPLGTRIDLKSLNEDLNAAWEYMGNKNFKFSTHQFRKFFAHFYIRRYKGTADAVRWNFRHVSKDMILHYTSQAMNAKQLAISKKELATEIVNSIITDNQYTSIGIANEIKDFKANNTLKAKILTIEETSKYINDKIDSEFKEVHAMEWGYCMFQKNYKGAVCEAKTGPIESRAEPSTCGRCKFLCTGQENIEFWQQTILLHQEIIENKLTTPIMKKESEKLITVSNNILNRHN